VNRLIGVVFTTPGGQAGPFGEQVRAPGRDLRQLGHRPVMLGPGKAAAARMAAGGARKPGNDNAVLPGSSHRSTLEHIF
jgi:hypothetical protein